MLCENFSSFLTTAHGTISQSLMTLLTVLNKNLAVLA